MPDREKVIRELQDALENAEENGKIYAEIRRPVLFYAISLLKEQKTVLQKMWNALFAEEDELEKQYAGTDKNDVWFMVYRPWLQRGFEIAIKTITEHKD